MKFNHNVLFISSADLYKDTPAAQALERLQAAITERGFHAHIVRQDGQQDQSQ